VHVHTCTCSADTNAGSAAFNSHEYLESVLAVVTAGCDM